jgi:hypothetical protein
MRTDTDSVSVAEAAVRFRDRGVVGFDIAGREAGFPPTMHLEAFQYLQRENFHVTIHAGEAFGLASIWEAVQFCGAERLGHGVRIIDDIDIEGEGASLGRLASFVRDRRIPLELCPTSNVHTGAVDSIAEHPIGILRDLGFRVTVNTDNRLMSNVSMTSEMTDLNEAFDWSLDDFRWLTINAMKSAFLPFDERLEIINSVIKPGYAAALRLTQLQRGLPSPSPIHAMSWPLPVWSFRTGRLHLIPLVPPARLPAWAFPWLPSSAALGLPTRPNAVWCALASPEHPRSNLPQKNCWQWPPPRTAGSKSWSPRCSAGTGS